MSKYIFSGHELAEILVQELQRRGSPLPKHLHVDLTWAVAKDAMYNTIELILTEEVYKKPAEEVA